MWFLYESLYLLGLLVYLPKTIWRRRLPHPGWSMRLGNYSPQIRQRLVGRQSIWVHAVSVGEVLAALPLIRLLTEAYPQHPLVLSTITPTGFAVASRQAMDGVIPIYFPLDLQGCIRRSLETIRPRILLLMESELWPGVIRQVHARELPIVLINGRISPRTFHRYRILKRWMQGLFDNVNLFLMQSPIDADRLREIAGPRDNIHVSGSLKWDASLGSRPAPERIQTLRQHLRVTDTDTVIVAGSTHRREEKFLLQAFRAVQANYPNARLIIAPRHLERLSEIQTLIHRERFQLMRVSQMQNKPWDVALVDTMGELPTYYGLATLTFIGGSLIAHGGQNPLEAAGLGKPILFGPFMHNFSEIAQQLLHHQAARQLSDSDELVSAIQELLSHPATMAMMGRNAQELVERSRGASRRTFEAVAAWVENPG